MVVQYFLKRGFGLDEHAFESTHGREGARVGFRCETFNDCTVGLEVADHAAQGDRFGGLGQAHASGSAASGLDVAQLAEPVRDFDEVIARDGESLRNFGDRYSVLSAGEVYQRPQPVVGI